jgi:hypothetical protein
MMKNPMEVLRMKEQDLLKVRREVDALRIAARLLEEPATEDTKREARHPVEVT